VQLNQKGEPKIYFFFEREGLLAANQKTARILILLERGIKAFAENCTTKRWIEFSGINGSPTWINASSYISKEAISITIGKHSC